jgi:nucleotide-binding universal stress UspA family protein
MSVVATLTNSGSVVVYKHILIATDGSELAGKAVADGLELAKCVNARTTAVYVTEPWSVTVTGDPVLMYPAIDYEKAAAQSAANVLSTVRDVANKAGVACETLHVSAFPAESIVEVAQAKGCDLIVMASHGRRGLSKLLLGSQTSKVLALTTIPVLVCR